MKDFIQVDICKVKDIIDGFRKSGSSLIYSSDVIRAYCGGFFSNLGISPAPSFNAQFARILARNSSVLGISKHGERPDKDDRQPPHPITSAEWSI